MNWLTESITNFVADIFNQIMEAVNNEINQAFQLATRVAASDPIIGAADAATVLAGMLVGVMAIKHILSIYILETEGDADADPMQLIVKCAQTMAVIFTSGLVYDFMADFAGNIFSFIMNAAELETKFTIGEAIQSACMALGEGTFLNTIMSIVLLVGIILLLIKAGIRGVELSLMRILYPVMAIDLMSTGREKWSAFFTSYCVVFFGYTIQVLSWHLSLCFMFGTSGFGGIAGEGTFLALCFSMAFLFFAIKAPKWLEKFIYSSGFGSLMAGGARTAGVAVGPMLMRTLAAK